MGSTNGAGDFFKLKSVQYNINTVIDLISEHTLISGHPPFCAGGDYCIGCVIVSHHAIDI